MNEALVVSNLLLWVAVLALLVVVFALSRQIGILYERVAPMGALMMDAGPRVGEAAPRLDLKALDGQPIQVGLASARCMLLFFLSPTCPVCKKLLPVLKSIRGAEASWLDIVLASDGELQAQQAFRERAGLLDFPYLLSAELGQRLHVGKLPYAVLIDEAGQIRGKGLVNSREQIDSLFAARDLGVASVQDYLEQPRFAKERS